MSLSPAERAARDRFFQVLLDAVVRLQTEGTDREVTLEALLEAAEMLIDHLERELEEFRQEQAE